MEPPGEPGVHVAPVSSLNSQVARIGEISNPRTCIFGLVVIPEAITTPVHGSPATESGHAWVLITGAAAAVASSAT